MTNHFRDKVAIVTGGASGIGRALCEELGHRGSAMVVVADINAEDAQQVTSSITSAGGQACAACLDVSREEDVQDLVDSIGARYGQLDFMFNNAGVAMCGEVRDMSLEQWQRIVAVNLWGVIYGTTAAYRLMLHQGQGHIINTASLGGLIPEPMATAYVTTKHAVVGLSTSLRAEAAGLGVKVSVVCPGMVRTQALDNATYIGVGREAAIAEMTAMGMADLTKSTRSILRGVERNQAIITDTRLTRLLWRLYRVNPSILSPFLKRGVSDIRALRLES